MEKISMTPLWRWTKSRLASVLVISAIAFLPISLFAAYSNFNGFWQIFLEYAGYGGTGADNSGVPKPHE